MFSFFYAHHSKIIMKKILIALLCLFAFTVLTSCKQTTPQSSLAPAQISAELGSHQAVLLDVRTPDEFNAGHVGNAILAPHDSIAQSIGKIAPAKDKRIYLYCRSGRRSNIALDTLKSMGYTDVINLGGLNDLAQYGLSIMK